MTDPKYPNANAKVKGILARLFHSLDGEPQDVADYKSLYFGLFKGISAAMEHTETYEELVDALEQLQCEAESAFIEQGE